MPDDFEVVVEVVKRKLSPYILQAQSIHSRFVVNAEAQYSNGKPFRLKTIILSSGTKICVPWNNQLKNLALTLLAVDGMLTTIIGTATITDFNGGSTTLTCDIIHNSRDKVGKLYFHSYISKTFDDSKDINSHRKTRRAEGSQYDEAEKRVIPPEFRFRKLGRYVNWDRIRGINLDRVVKTTDAALLMTCLDDVAIGDVSQEDADPRLYHTLQLAQYSTQYLLACQEMLRDRTELIQKALNCFDKEEQELDVQLAKMRSRNKGLQREQDGVDHLQEQYLELLDTLNPNAAADFRLQVREEARRRGGSKRGERKGKKESSHKGTAKPLNKTNRRQLKSRAASGPREDEDEGEWCMSSSVGERCIEQPETRPPFSSTSIGHSRHIPHFSQEHGQAPTREQRLSSDRDSKVAHRDNEEDTAVRWHKEDKGWGDKTVASERQSQWATAVPRSQDLVEPMHIRSPSPPHVKNMSPTDTPWTHNAADVTHDSQKRRQQGLNQSTVPSPESTPLVKPSSSDSIDEELVVPVVATKPVLRRIASREFKSVQSSSGPLSRSPSPFVAPAAKLPSESAAAGDPIVHHSSPLQSALSAEMTAPRESSPSQTIAKEDYISLDPVRASRVDTSEIIPPVRNGDVVLSKTSKTEDDSEGMPPPLRPPLRDSMPDSTGRFSQTGNMSVDSLGAAVGVSGDDHVDYGSARHTDNSINSSFGALSNRGGYHRNTSLSADVLEEHDELFEHHDSDLSMSLSASIAPQSALHPAPRMPDVDDIQNFSMQEEDSLQWPSSVAPAIQEMESADLARNPSFIASVEKTGPVASVGDMVMESPDISIDNHDSRGDHNQVSTELDATGMNSFDEDSRQFGSEEGMDSPGSVTFGRALKSDVVSFLQHRHVRESGDNAGGDEESAEGGLGDTGGVLSFASNSEGDEVLMGTNRLHSYGDTISSLDSPIRMTASKSPTIPQMEEVLESDIRMSSGGDDMATADTGGGEEVGSPVGSEKSLVKWVLGRAPLELVETANALDVFVSAVRFDTSSYEGDPPKISLQLEFLGELSPPSKPVQTSLRMSVLPVSFAAHMPFTRESSMLLADEIASRGENLALWLHILCLPDDTNVQLESEVKELAEAEIGLYVMIEDSCSIVRQEIDVCDKESGECIGAAVIDVRGHHLLSRCS